MTIDTLYVVHNWEHTINISFVIVLLCKFAFCPDFNLMLRIVANDNLWCLETKPLSDIALRFSMISRK